MNESSARARIGQPAPEFEMPSTRALDTLDLPVRLADYRGRWLVLLFYPLDFTFVCPTELVAFSHRLDEFRAEGADVVGVSTDSVYAHRAWVKTPVSQGGVGELRYPLASDLTHAVSRAYGVLDEVEGICFRGTFVIDPEGRLRSSLVHDRDVGRSVDETLRMVRALKTGSLCPVDWKPGAATLKVG